MAAYLPLRGVRVHLAASVPDEATPEAKDGIEKFVESFASQLFLEGGTLIHGNHRTVLPFLRLAAERTASASISREKLTLVRSAKYAQTPEHFNEVRDLEKFAVVHIIPSKPGDPNENLVPMREWMAERCDAVIAIGGRWYDKSKERAGVPRELEESLNRGKPGFVLAGFGGATAGYWQDDSSLELRLRNGLSLDGNRRLAASTDPVATAREIVDQLKRLPLIRNDVVGQSRFRILALDGGGIRGAFTAAVLTKWAELLAADHGRSFIKHFDLVAGTSTGAILAIGLGLGMTPQRILDFYRTKGPEIFPHRGWFRQWFVSKHELETLKKCLMEEFGQKSLSKDSCCRLVVATARAKNGVAEVIRTNHAPDKVGATGYSAVDAAMASAAAPTYFDQASVPNPIASEEFLDGGVWANNPVLPAITESVGNLRVPLNKIDVLSIGTLMGHPDFTKQLAGGYTSWGPAISNLFFAAQESGSARRQEGAIHIYSVRAVVFSSNG